MQYIAVAFIGFFLGAWIAYLLMERKRVSVQAEHERALGKAREAQAQQQRNAHDAQTIKAERAALDYDRQQFDARVIRLSDLEQENRLLKRDILNIDVTVKKLRLDRDLQAESQDTLDRRSRELAERYLADVEKWTGSSINANNYAACKQRLLKAIEWCRGIGFAVPASKEEELLDKLKDDYENEVRAALEREEQARIKAQIREEQLRKREIDKEMNALDRERAAIQAALTKALADAHDTHAVEVERLKARLAEAEGKQRALSQAQLTKAGHIYVISNIGSFGENVFKIGMTRRLQPRDRIAELGDASVPFPFDVHMMISCTDAPSLENALHREFHKHRLNKVNPRKEFFRLDLETLRQFVEQRHGKVQYVADAEALQYRQSLDMSLEDQEYIERVFEEAEEETHTPDVD